MFKTKQCCCVIIMICFQCYSANLATFYIHDIRYIVILNDKLTTHTFLKKIYISIKGLFLNLYLKIWIKKYNTFYILLS
jgi:hypothetical protein